MKIYTIKSKKEKNGYYKLPSNLTNRQMFCYPHIGDTEYQEEQRKLINTIVISFCECYKYVNIGLMGHDMMIIFTSNDNINSEEHNVYYHSYKAYKNKLIYFDDVDDYYRALRYEKLDNLLKNTNDKN